MDYYVGIDGGASKTHFVLCDEQGQIVAQYISAEISCAELGVGRVCKTLAQGMDALCKNIAPRNIVGLCIGIPCYGEHPKTDATTAQEIQRALPPLPLRFENDVALACAGSLALQSGIVILAGTGSMAWGCDRHKEPGRCGGWSEFFSDEGSGYWLGRRTLEMFFKQADGRIEKGRLYDIVRTYFHLDEDRELLDKMDELGYSRKNVAALQPLLADAARAGDESARQLYKQAAQELALMVRGLRKNMELEPSSLLSYSGGLFDAGDLVLEPFKDAIGNLDMIFTEPLLSPAQGAVLLAVDRFNKKRVSHVKQGLLGILDK